MKGDIVDFECFRAAHAHDGFALERIAKSGQGVAVRAYEPHQPRRVSLHESVIGNIACYHTAGRDKGPAPDRDAAPDRRIRANRGTVLHQGFGDLPVTRPFETSVRIDGSWVYVIREAGMGADENASF